MGFLIHVRLLESGARQHTMNHYSLVHFRRYLTGLPLFFLVTGMTGCYLPLCAEYLVWAVELVKVEKPSLAEERYGALRHMGSGQFEDGLVKIDGDANDPMQAFFVLTNKTQYDLKIDWRKAKFVDIYGRTRPVEVTQLRQPRLENLTEGHTRDDGTFTEIKHAQSSRIRATPAGRPQIRSVCPWEEMRGRTVKVLLPLEAEGRSYEYVFTYQITRFGSRI